MSKDTSRPPGFKRRNDWTKNSRKSETLRNTKAVITPSNTSSLKGGTSALAWSNSTLLFPSLSRLARASSNILKEKSNPITLPAPSSDLAAVNVRSPVPVPRSRILSWPFLTTAETAFFLHRASKRKLITRLSRS